MNLNKLFLLNQLPAINLVYLRGMKHFPLPPTFDHVEYPERAKLRFIDKVPTYPANIKAPKMQKKLKLMRGYEDVHNFLQHKQYGIMATGGGRLKWNHFEMTRLLVGRKMNTDKMFAIWRVDAPWQPLTKKGQGMRMGGGKGAIDHYVTPIKAGRIILEVGGKCEYKEVQPWLEDIAMKMPFKAIAVSQEMLDQMKEQEKWEEENNQNRFTMKYLIQNNMGGCQRWCSPTDLKYFGKCP